MRCVQVSQAEQGLSGFRRDGLGRRGIFWLVTVSSGRAGGVCQGSVGMVKGTVRRGRPGGFRRSALVLVRARQLWLSTLVLVRARQARNVKSGIGPAGMAWSVKLCHVAAGVASSVELSFVLAGQEWWVLFSRVLSRRPRSVPLSRVKAGEFGRDVLCPGSYGAVR